MRNYVIINGVNSLTIKGLAINELPPIVKPPMRVLQEEIDGRDGDITTNLGYGAYDKTMTIGLYIGYDINEIIAFFNEEGTIVFSDENDKYYKFKIIEQIDYEALIKFRTASITFHCQPFKYPISETPIVITPTFIEQEGTEMTINNTEYAPMKMDLKGNTEQTTTTGKNIFNANDTNYVVRYTNQTISVNGANISVTSPTSYGNGFYIWNIPVEVGREITISYNNINEPSASVNNRIQYAFSDTIVTEYDTSVSTDSTPIDKTDKYVTVTATNRYLRLLLRIASGGSYTINEVQVEYNNQKTSYEPFTNGASPNPSYPQNIKVVTGNNIIKVENKNLFDKNNANTINGYIQSTTNKIISSNNAKILYISCKPNTTYAITNSEITPFIVACAENVPALNDVVLNRTTSGATTLVYTTENNANYLLVYYLNSSSTLTEQQILNSIQIEQNTQATSYVAHKEQSYPINLGDIEYCEIGDNKDRIFKNVVGDVDYSSERELGKWYIKKNIPKLVFNGTEEGWSYVQNSSIPFKFTYSNMVLPGSQSKLPLLLTSHYLGVKWNDLSNYTYAVVMSASSQEIRFKNGDISSLSAWETWLSTHNVTAYYVTTTPTYTILNNTLQEQLDNLYNARSYDEQTNISQENNDEAFILGIKAMQNDSDKAVINNIGNIYSKPTIDIEGTGIVDVYLGENQIFSANVDTEIIIDSKNLEAYKPDGTLANRQITGNISNLKLPTGNTTIQVAGEYDKATITDYVRWL